MAADPSAARPARHRPRTATVFVAAFVAGAVAAVGVNRVLDLRLAQAKPQVECEPVFVALRALPAGAAVTVWDVALRDLPKAMVPATALRVSDSFAGHLLKFPLREGQPLIWPQLVPPEVAAPVAPEKPTPEQDDQEPVSEEAFVAPVPLAAPLTPVVAPVTDPPVAVEASHPIADSHPTGNSRPFEDEPDTGPANPAPAAAAGAAVSAEQADREPVVEVAELPPIEVSAATPQPDEPAAAELAASATPPLTPPAEPTLASPPPGPATRPLRLPSDLFAGTAEDQLDATLDTPSRPAARLAELPSVMASGEPAAPEPAPAGSGDPVRYLVVPERIARQVDTAFTTPPPPEAAGEPAALVSQPDRAAEVTRPATPSPRPQPGGTRKAPGQEIRPQPPQPSARPKPAGRPAQPAAAVPPPTGPRAWGGMFPNVQAGLEAMGSWRVGGRAAPAQNDRGPTSR